MYQIITIPNPILNKPCRKVEKIDDRIREIIKEMTKTLQKLDHPKGVGLAANQVGLGFAVFVFKHGKKIRPVINPKIIWHSDDEVLDERGKNTMLEGCLSIPKYYGSVKRFSKIKLSYLGLDNRQTEEDFEMPEAVIIQHETDHLNGHLFVEKLLQQKGRLYKLENNGEEKLIEVEI